MSLPKDDAEILSARWIEGVLLKRDVFSNVERGRFRGDDGEVDAVLRRLDEVPWWSYPLARHLFARERRALALAKDLQVGPELLWAGRQALVRGFIDGVALHLAKPYGDVAYFRSAKESAAPAASGRHLPQRSRQGAELAARRRRPRLISPTSSSPPASSAAAGCSGSRPMKTSGTCSSTSAAMRRRR